MLFLGYIFMTIQFLIELKLLKPSDRGELEITDLNRLYLNDKKLDVRIMERGYAWLDTGTHDSLLEASQFISTIEKSPGAKSIFPGGDCISYRIDRC